MLNERKTLKKLHETFPKLSLDDLFKILDCYIEEYQVPSPHRWSEYVRTVPLTNINYDRPISESDFIASCTYNKRSREIKSN